MWRCFSGFPGERGACLKRNGMVLRYSDLIGSGRQVVVYFILEILVFVSGRELEG